MAKVAKTLKQQIYEARIKVWEAEEAYRTQLYYETMPEYDPQYKYCYSTSSIPIPYSLQSVDTWVRAIIQHMGERKPGHGGAKTKAIVVTVPDNLSETAVENWIGYVTKQLRKRVAKRTKVVKPTSP